jgi:hypothetical protein
MTLVRPPKRPTATPADTARPAAPQTPHKPLMAWIALGLFLMSIGFAIGLFTGAFLTVSPPQQARPAHETQWRLSNICIASYGMQYAGRLDSAELALGCSDMAQAYSAAHPAIVDECLSHIWDIEAAMCIDLSAAPFDTAPLDAQAQAS